MALVQDYNSELANDGKTIGKSSKGEGGDLMEEEEEVREGLF